MDVAKTILAQLGGGMFLSMTGAHTFIGRKDGLSFKLPSNFATDGINYIRITHNVMDTYDVEFGKTRGLQYTQSSIHEGIYFDNLQGIISRTTGLALSLGPRHAPSAQRSAAEEQIIDGSTQVESSLMSRDRKREERQWHE